MTHEVAPAGGPTDRRPTWPVVAWSLWDWGSAAFNAVITTFVFTVYLTSDSFGDGAATKLGWTIFGAGLLVIAFAPISGRRADQSGRRTFWLTVNTLLVVLAAVGMFFVKPSPEYLWLGLGLLAAGNVFFELAQVNYNAMLNQISTPQTVGRVSGLGWGLGYIGGIVLLLFVYFGLINPEVGLFGITSEQGLDVRVAMLVCAAWTVLFSLPVILTIRDEPSVAASDPESRTGLADSYRHLWRTVRDLWRDDRNTARFLLASAVFRDGLAGVFTFGGVLAAGAFGFSPGDVIIFGVAANVVAGIATIAFGVLDDRLGPKPVIVFSLSCMLVAGSCVFLLHDQGTVMFWIFGLVLCIFVGPAQSASRTFLARLIPEGEEGEIFGLYATTGRVANVISPAAWSAAIAFGAMVTGVTEQDDAMHWGILGILLVLALGLALVLPVKGRTRQDSALVTQELPT